VLKKQHQETRQLLQQKQKETKTTTTSQISIETETSILLGPKTKGRMNQAYFSRDMRHMKSENNLIKPYSKAPKQAPHTTTIPTLVEKRFHHPPIERTRSTRVSQKKTIP